MLKRSDNNCKIYEGFTIDEGGTGKDVFDESSIYDIELTFTFERNHVLTKQDLISMEKEAYDSKPKEYDSTKSFPPDYIFYGFSSDLEMKENLVEGYIVKKIF